MVERGDEPDVAREQHAVAEHVARHVADAGDGEVGGLDVDAELAEVALRRLPRAARGDAHRLVVVAHRPARRERVAQPEPVFVADRVGVVGERRRALVGGDDQVRIVGVVALDLRRRHDAGAHPVVGEVEQAAQVVLVAGDPLAQVRLAVGRRGRALQHEAALGADRDDDDVLHHLRLDQAQDLGAEILGAVGPAQPAARDLAAAQVHALEPRRVDEDLEHRLRLGQPGHPGRVELERQVAARAALGVAPPEVGARRRLDQRNVRAQHAVLGQVVHGVERLGDRARRLRAAHRALGPQRRVEAVAEHRHQLPRDAGMRGQRGLDERLRQREADLPQVLGVGAQHHDVGGRQPRRSDQAVEVVVLDLAAEDPRERVLEGRVQRVDLEALAGDRAEEPEVEHPHHRSAGRRDPVRALVLHLEAHALEHRQAVGQRHRRAAAEDLEAHHAGGGLRRPVQRQRQRRRGVERRHQGDVGHGRAGGEILAVAGRKRAAEAAVERVAARLARVGDQRRAQVVGPAARGGAQARLQLADVERRELSGRGAHDDLDARQHRLGQVDVEIRCRPVAGLGEHRLPFLPQLGRVVLARDVDETRHEALERVAAHEQAEALVVAQVQDRHRGARELVLRHLEQLVARIRLQHVDQHLVGVAAGGQPGAGHDVRDLAPQQRNVGGVRAVRRRREQPEKAVLAADLALGVEALDPDVVEVAGPVHRRARRGLGHDQQLGPPGVGAHFRRQRREAGGDVLALGIAEDPEAAAGHDAQNVLAVDAVEIEAAVAEEGEVVVRHPAQERGSLRHFGGGKRRRRALDVGDDRERLRGHLLPVLDGVAHVGEHAQQVGRQRVTLVRIGNPVDLDADERFGPAAPGAFGHEADQRPGRVALDGDDRVDDQVLRQAVAVHLHRHRVDQERHVVVADLDDGVRRLPAVLGLGRIEHPQLRLPGVALPGELPLRQRGAAQIGRRALGEVLGGDLPVITLNEVADLAALRCRDARRGKLHDGGENLGAAVGFGRSFFHCCLLARWGCAGRRRGPPEQAVSRHAVVARVARAPPPGADRAFHCSPRVARRDSGRRAAPFPARAQRPQRRLIQRRLRPSSRA